MTRMWAMAVVAVLLVGALGCGRDRYVTDVLHDLRIDGVLPVHRVVVVDVSTQAELSGSLWLILGTGFGSVEGRGSGARPVVQVHWGRSTDEHLISMFTPAQVRVLRGGSLSMKFEWPYLQAGARTNGWEVLEKYVPLGQNQMRWIVAVLTLPPECFQQITCPGLPITGQR